MINVENPIEILIADDEPAVALAIKSALKFCGYRALAVTSGEAALDCLQAEPARFSVLISDHNMPGIGGIALVKALRATGYPGRIVILSGYLTRENESQYEVLGVDQILAKPFNLERLRLALDRALHPAPGHAPQLVEQ
jgi:CheY-like chemotaxis protein